MVYKGKNKIDGEWIYGVCYIDGMISQDLMNWYPVIPETVEVIENKEEK